MTPQPFTPRPWQTPAALQIANERRCGIFMPVGGGKCGASFMAMDELSVVEDIYPCLIVAPKRVARDTWPDETKKWEEFTHFTISRSKRSSI